MSLMILTIVTYFLTLFTLILIPIYWKIYGSKNFLWFSDIGLFLTVIALWLKSSLLISTAALLILPFELFWIIDYIFRLVSRRPLLGVTNYMFEPQYPLFVRALSLFHIPLPIIWIWCMLLWGYNNAGLIYAILLSCILLLATYFLTTPKENINWVYAPKARKWTWMPSLIWLLVMLTAYPLLIIWPLHFLLLQIF